MNTYSTYLICTLTTDGKLNILASGKTPEEVNAHLSLMTNITDREFVIVEVDAHDTSVERSRTRCDEWLVRHER